MAEMNRFTRDHEWARRDGELVRVGISDYAQDALGDIVFVELPQPGRRVAAGEAVAEVESTKTVSSVMAPVAGEVVEVNAALASQPETINRDPFAAGWLFALRPVRVAELDDLLDETEYRKYVEELSR
ncbi:MAG: glycine cleavage system protein GcvH [Nitrospirota bacterium]|nr:glycine cleavage system protein GcvH [Nitrospirota bacterium]